MSSESPPVATTVDSPSSADEAPAESVDLAGEAVEGTGLDRLDGRLADHVPRLDQLDPAQGGGMGKEGIEADGHPRSDGPTEVLAGAGDGVEGCGRAEVDDDAGAAEQVVGADGVGDPVGTDLLRIVVEDGHAAAHPGLEHDGGDGEPPRHHLAEVGR